MRIVHTLPPLALALALAACSSTGGTDRYGSTLSQLSDDCQARGGILAPTGQQSGNPARDNVCKITAETARANAPSDPR